MMKKLEDRPWWPELVALKDVLSLRELGERFGAAPAAISNALKRNRLDRNGAPPGPRANRDPAVKRAAEEAVARVESETMESVAVLPTPVVAEVEQTTPATTAEVVVPNPNPSGLARGYRVTIDDMHYVVVASDIAEAARIAHTAARGTVAQIQLLGNALCA